MRRAQGGPWAPGKHYGGASQHIEDENDELQDQLQDKVKSLKNLVINIGEETRSQNTLLGQMDDDYEKSGNFLERSLKRVGIISRGSQNYHVVILFAFCFVVFLLLWVILKFR
ncbi:unnamed protein product [Meganyctiphanes norvegica]|uniref:t-SNARE coiled-coil homology domain-containing protein n=1 Tax=Meganyctiphanes norvegica TaxID=48144 RepID=A0AAV2S4C3_MEGNR